MRNIVEIALSWMQTHSSILWLAGVSSILVFFATLIGLPLLIIKLPENYLLDPSAYSFRKYVIGTPLDIPFLITKNLLGGLLVVCGVAMLVLPGQGLLTIFSGLLLLKFPGKQKLIHAILRRKKVVKTANWIRGKAHKPPLRWPG
ncbi:MAG: PGPGW domain-containing protein [Thermodesulfobacteriota bacterium]